MKPRKIPTGIISWSKISAVTNDIAEPVKQRMTTKQRIKTKTGSYASAQPPEIICGDSRSRTDDPLLARQML